MRSTETPMRGHATTLPRPATRGGGTIDEHGNSTLLLQADFLRLSEFIYTTIGIKLNEMKKTMLQARLQKRLRSLGLGTYAEYCDYLFSEEGMVREVGYLINAVTTNKTDFFREPEHFRILTTDVLPQMERQHLLRGGHLNVWSTACSSGQEPYTLAMVLADYAERNEGFSSSILGTDISTAVLQKASEAVYSDEDVIPVPEEFKRKYLLRSKDRKLGLVKIIPELRGMVELRRLNLMEEQYGFRTAFEVIFCRNVIIYFDKPTQAALLRKLYRHLAPGGVLFLGHSESMNGIDLPLEVAAPTVYRKALR